MKLWGALKRDWGSSEGSGDEDTGIFQMDPSNDLDVGLGNQEALGHMTSEEGYF